MLGGNSADRCAVLVNLCSVALVYLSGYSSSMYGCIALCSFWPVTEGLDKRIVRGEGFAADGCYPYQANGPNGPLKGGVFRCLIVL